MVKALVADLLAKLPPNFDVEKASAKYPVRAPAWLGLWGPSQGTAHQGSCAVLCTQSMTVALLRARHRCCTTTQVRYEQSLNQVLCQEMLRYNRLLDVIRGSLQVRVRSAIPFHALPSAAPRTRAAALPSL